MGADSSRITPSYHRRGDIANLQEAKTQVHEMQRHLQEIPIIISNTSTYQLVLLDYQQDLRRWVYDVSNPIDPSKHGVALHVNSKPGLQGKHPVLRGKGRCEARPGCLPVVEPQGT